MLTILRSACTNWITRRFGFLFASLICFLGDASFAGRWQFEICCKNWAAAFKLPFVHLGLAKDFWREFDDRYLELEEGLHSTFFVIPRRTMPESELTVRRLQPEPQAMKPGYCRCDSKAELRGTRNWLAWDRCMARHFGQGREELEEIRRLSGASELGVGCIGSTMTKITSGIGESWRGL